MRPEAAVDPFANAPTIAERVALGREINRIHNGSIVPFPTAWTPELLMSFSHSEGRYVYDQLGKGHYQTGLWLYRDDEGSVIAAALRLDHPTERKQVLPLRATCALASNPRWEVRAIDEPRPLYGLDLLAAAPDRPVIVVEGEKAADAGRAIFPGHVVITWPGGAPGVTKVDLRPLAGRDFTIWPDNDEDGRSAARKLGARLKLVGAASVRVVQLPPSFPRKWDVADPIPAQGNG